MWRIAALALLICSGCDWFHDNLVQDSFTGDLIRLVPCGICRGKPGPDACGPDGCSPVLAPVSGSETVVPETTSQTSEPKSKEP